MSDAVYGGNAVLWSDLPEGAGRWREAIYAATDEIGLDVFVLFYWEGDRLTYGWGMFGGREHTHDEWLAFHKACVLCEPLRPDVVIPSFKLMELTGGFPSAPDEVNEPE